MKPSLRPFRNIGATSACSILPTAKEMKTCTSSLAPVRTFIYSLIDRRPFRVGCDRCHLAHLPPGRLLDPGSRTRPPDKAAGRGRQRHQGDQLLRVGGQCRVAGPAKSMGQHRRHPPGDFSPSPRHALADPTIDATTRLPDIGMIKRVIGTYRYYLTNAWRAATAAVGRTPDG